MRHRLLLQLIAGIVAFAAFSLVSPDARAADHSDAPLMDFQGKIVGLAGEPVPGPATITIRLFSAEEEGELLYSELHSEVRLVDGIFELPIGGGVVEEGEFDVSLFAGEPAWLEVWVGDERLAPRRSFAEVPYAMIARNAVAVGEIEAHDIITTHNFEKNFAIQIYQVAESQIPDEITRDSELAEEAAIRDQEVAALWAEIEALRARLARLEACGCGEPGTIHGLKWLDENGNGVRDSSEPGLPGVTIYVDLNRNGEHEAEEPRRVTLPDDPNTAFDEAGHYWLTGLEPGVHVIREVVPDGFIQTFPPEFHEVTLESGQTAEGIDFGNVREQLGTLHGTKWLDENGDGLRDEGEPGLAGVVIYLDVNDDGVQGPLEPSATTLEDDSATAFDESGEYWLIDLRPGVYTVREVVPEGFVQTFPPNIYHVVTLEPGQQVDGLDFGNQPITIGAISGRVWIDGNGDGSRDPGEPGLPGMTIYLDLDLNQRYDPNEPVATSSEDDPLTAFDESGLYWFDGLNPGEYEIREDVPIGFSLTFPPSGVHRVTLHQSGEAIAGLDFGNALSPAQ